MFETLGKQLRKPSGFFGLLVSKLMEVRNKGFYEKIIKELAIKSGEKIYKIGYGPGLGINIIARKTEDCRISGIDFSELMYNKAILRNRKFIKNGRVSLKYGDFLTSHIESEKYNKIFCVNVIYFWPDLYLVFKKIHSCLEPNGEYWIYMSHEREIEKLKFTKDFCKYSIEKVEEALKTAGFNEIESKLDKGYYVKAVK